MRKSKRYNFFAGAAICSLLLFTLQLKAGTIRADYYVRVFGIEHGLAQGTVSCLAQTPDGYIWMGNQESLSRFDGFRFINFTTKNSPVLKSSWIRSLALSSEHGLLIGTFRGGIYALRNGKFHNLIPDNYPKLAQAIIFALAASDDGTIWAGTSEGLFSVQKGKIRHYDRSSGIEAETILSLLVDREQRLWIGTLDQGLWLYEKGKFTHFNKNNGLKDNRVWALAKDLKKGIWIGSGTVLTYFDNQNFSYFPVPVSKTPDQITGLALGADGSVWLTIQNEGIWRFHNGTFSSATELEGLGSNLTTTVLIDREQNIWVGTNGAGVSQLVSNKVQVISKEEGLSARQIWTVMEAQDGSLWVGTHGGGLNRIKNGAIEHYGLKQGLPSLFTTALFQSTHDQTIWAGTEDSGIFKIDERGITSFSLGNSIAENTVYAISEQQDKTLLIGTAAGIVFFKNDQIIDRLTTKNGLNDNAVREFAPADRPDEFWVSTDIGLNLLYQKKIIGSWRKSDGLSEEALNGLYYDKEKNLWIGTYGGGLIHFKNNRFTTISTQNGLHNDVVYAIVEDKSGRFWMSSNRGIFSVSRKELLDFVDKKIKRINSFPLGLGDGLKALECNGGRQPAGWLSSSGFACFPTINGIAMLDTRLFSTDEQAPPIVFEKFTFNNLEVEIAPRIYLAPGKRNIDIEFSTPFFSAPDKILFQYRLVPFEQEWHETRIMRMAHYTNIPPGNYRFEVRSSNRFGVFNRDSSALEIVFLPFFYETTWFRLVLILLILLIVIGYVRWRVAHLEKRKKELEIAVSERTKELQEAYKQMEQMSLTDPLTQLYNRRFFHNVIEREVSLVIRRYTRPADNPPFAIGFLMIDIDHFKSINDNYGHLTGDQFLQLLSKRFLNTLRSSDLIVRWGGEEFLILSKQNDFEHARQLCRRLLSVINRQPFQIENNTIRGTISIGFCPFPLIPAQPRVFSWEDNVNLADQTLYYAKNSGRNCSAGLRICREQVSEEEIQLIKNDFSAAIEQKIVEILIERG